jgi:hypothetical protein
MLAAAHLNVIEEYRDGKDSFVKEHEPKALTWKRGASKREALG